jgi:hypothetical protein
MIVAALAYDQLEPAARDWVDALLKLNPQYATPVRGVAGARTARVAFLCAATWPDFIKEPTAGYPNDGIPAFRAALAAHGTSGDVESYDLAWLLHLVGDVHQPLHATSRYSAAFPDGDEGGNRAKVTCSPAC